MSHDDHANGWAEYQRLVLAELERHNKWLNVIDTKLNQALISFNLGMQAIGRLEKALEDHDERLSLLERERIGDEAVEKYRQDAARYKKWVVGLSITTIFSVAGVLAEVLPQLTK